MVRARVQNQPRKETDLTKALIWPFVQGKAISRKRYENKIFRSTRVKKHIKILMKFFNFWACDLEKVEIQLLVQEKISETVTARVKQTKFRDHPNNLVNTMVIKSYLCCFLLPYCY